MSIGIIPLGDRFIVKPIEEKKTTILIPDTAKDKPVKGEVVALGTGKKDNNGNVILTDVKIGDLVMFTKWGSADVEHEGEKYLIIKGEDIQAKIVK